MEINLNGSNSSALESMISDFRLCWKQLALTDIAYKLLAFLILTPLVGATFRAFVAISGRSVLADTDMLTFVYHPLGWLTCVVVGGAWVGILALEQTALMAIASGVLQKQRIGVRQALEFTLEWKWPVLRLTMRMAAWVLLTAAPFLTVGGLVYVALLTKHDINYYLAEKPPVFWVATGIIGTIVLAMIVVLVRMLITWVFALPLVLFENVATREVLRTSRERTKGHCRTLTFWIVGWFLASILLSALASIVVGLIGRFLMPHATGSLGLVVLAVGGILVLWGTVNFITTLLSAATFAVILFNLYRKLGSSEQSQPRAAQSSVKSIVIPFSNRTVLGGVLVAVLLVVIVGVVAIDTVRLEDHTDVTAHRGASASAPENTLAAVKRAIADGADWVEVDVQETTDGKVVVVHDSDLKKVAGVDLKIWEATAAQLTEIDVGSHFSPAFSNERVPTLEQVLETCKGKVRLNIELKYYGHDQRLEERVADLVESHGMESDVVIMSLNYAAVRKMKSVRSGVGQSFRHPLIGIN